MSFKGYKITTALYRNKDALKALIILITGYSYFTEFKLETFLVALGLASSALLGKLVLDAFDYFFTEVEN